MSNIKDFFQSRWGTKGWIVQADFSQLEVLGLAIITEDKQLKEDIRDGLDMHTVRAAQLFNVSQSQVTKKQRTTAKIFSFSLQYGSGAKGMAAQLGVDVGLATAFIKQYYARYKGVKAWQDMVAKQIKQQRKPTTLKSPLGSPVGESVYKSITGRRYTFREYDAPEFMRDRGIDVSFSPTEMKNYMIQGFATGDVVPEVGGKLYHALLNSEYKDTCLMVNTVHDSFIFDIRGDAVKPALKLVNSVLVASAKLVEDRFNIEIDLPLAVEYDIGRTWGDLQTIHNINVFIGDE